MEMPTLAEHHLRFPPYPGISFLTKSPYHQAKIPDVSLSIYWQVSLNLLSHIPQIWLLLAISTTLAWPSSPHSSQLSIISILDF